MAKQQHCTRYLTIYIGFSLIAFLFGLATNAKAQNYAWRKAIDTLCSPTMHGRGYTNNGAEKAANYLKAELIEMGLHPVKGKYGMQVTELINTFDSVVNLSAGKINLEVGGALFT